MTDKLFITEISEEDFRKLDITAYALRKVKKRGTLPHEPEEFNAIEWVPCKMNNVLDSYIDFAIANGYKHDLETLTCPLTIAIHKENGPEPKDYYLDKFVSLLGPATYQDAPCVLHLYSTRDYFEDKEGIIRILKRETKAIYRVHLSEKWADMFVLKHKTVISKTFDDDAPEHRHYVEDYYYRGSENEEWKLESRIEVEQIPGQATYSRAYKETD